MFLKGWEIVKNILPLPHDEAVVTMGEDDGGKLLFIHQKMTVMDMHDWHLVFSPLEFAGEKEIAMLV